MINLAVHGELTVNRLNFGPCVKLTTAFIFPETFTVHVDVLRNRSAYWRTLIPEPEPNEDLCPICISGSANTLRVYLAWVYGTKCDIAILIEEGYDKSSLKNPNPTHEELRSRTVLNLMRLWCFADRVQDPQCRNAIIDSLILHQYWQTAIEVELICEVICKSNVGSGLRKWLARSIQPSLTPDNFDQFTSNMPPEMFRDVFKAFVTEKGIVGEERRPTGADSAIFYE